MGTREWSEGPRRQRDVDKHRSSTINTCNIITTDTHFVNIRYRTFFLNIIDKLNQDNYVSQFNEQINIFLHCNNAVMVINDKGDKGFPKRIEILVELYW